MPSCRRAQLCWRHLEIRDSSRCECQLLGYVTGRWITLMRDDLQMMYQPMVNISPPLPSSGADDLPFSTEWSQRCSRYSMKRDCNVRERPRLNKSVHKVAMRSTSQRAFVTNSNEWKRVMISASYPAITRYTRYLRKQLSPSNLKTTSSPSSSCRPMESQRRT